MLLKVASNDWNQRSDTKVQPERNELTSDLGGNFLEGISHREAKGQETKISFDNILSIFVGFQRTYANVSRSICLNIIFEVLFDKGLRRNFTSKNSLVSAIPVLD